MPDTIAIDVVSGPTEALRDLVEAFARLLPQLAPAAPLPTEAQLREIVAAPGTTLLVARDTARGGHIVGAPRSP
jgi:hypothetical protein